MSSFAGVRIEEKGSNAHESAGFWRDAARPRHGRGARRRRAAARARSVHGLGGGAGSPCRADPRAGYNPAAMTDHATAAPPAAPRDAGGSGQAAGRRLRVLLVTGLSGAGHSTALNVLEDLGSAPVANL